MNGFDLRIPIRELKVLRWHEGRIVLELRPAFDAVDPIVVELPESQLAGIRAILDAGDPARVIQAPAVSGPARSADELVDAEIVAAGEAFIRDAASIRPLPVNDDANASLLAAYTPVPLAAHDDDGLTDEERQWLARSAG